MSHHTSESYIKDLSEQVRLVAKRNPQKRLHAQAVLDTVSDRAHPVEYRKQLLRRFLIQNKEVSNESH